MKIGVLGVGHLAKAMLMGFLRANLSPRQFLLSPRGQAQQLAKEHGFELADDNEELVNNCDRVILAVQPKDAPDAVAGLPWRKGQILISVCAGIPLNELPVAPARVVRAMPLTAAEINASPTVCFPSQRDVVALFEHIGIVIGLENEQEFEVASVNAAIYGWVQDLIRLNVQWLVQQSTNSMSDASSERNLATMRRLVSLTFAAAGRLIAEKPESMEALLDALVTPGGITELGLEKLKEQGHPAIWQDACACVLERLR